MAEPWYNTSGKNGDVVCSTRIRLARNLANYPFPIKMTDEQKKAVCEEIKEIFSRTNSYLSENFDYIQLDELTNSELLSYAERHVLSPEFISGDKTGKAFIVNKDSSISVMINEEDHIRIQSVQAGEELQKTFDMADKIDNLISERTKIAFDDRLGYLTQCPTNLGTGMRASLMMHLPALHESGAIPRITSNLSKLGIVMRGTYGEGSNVTGAMYQLSNQITLGLKENEAIENLVAIASQIVEKERNYRKELTGNIAVQDKICRALGTLKFARILSTAQYMELISLVKFGMSTGLISGITQGDINKLTNMVQPHVLLPDSSASERDFRRAQLVRDALKSAE
ncbi:MAG: protein arginine kinase [Clostridia bacterium]|nr:protein arginine kinase [Clostridia bacterium]